MKEYKAKAKPFSGSDWVEVAPQARHLLRSIARRTKRRPYIRSAYFSGQKIFLTYFWHHLSQKPFPERVRRLKCLPCAIELITKSRQVPDTHKKSTHSNELFYRFIGRAADGTLFAVQIKENQRTDRKEFISVFQIQKIPR